MWQGQTDLRLSLLEQQTAACPESPSPPGVTVSLPVLQTPSLCWCWDQKGMGRAVANPGPPASVFEPLSVIKPQQKGLSCSRWGPWRPATASLLGLLLACSRPWGWRAVPAVCSGTCSEAQALPVAKSHPQGECT